MTPTVLIVDDHERFRCSARRMLEAAGFEVVGELDDGTGAVDAVRDSRPDVVLLDVQLPDEDGFAVARRLRDAGLDCAVILTSSRDWSHADELVSDAGACGFVHKGDLSGPALTALLG